MFNNILVPLDGSELAEQALDKAEEIAKKTSASIHLVHVVSHRPELEARFGGSSMGDVSLSQYEIDQARELVRVRMTKGGDYLNEIAARLKSDGVKSVVTAVLEGEAGEQILEYSQNNDIDLIVITSRGHGGIKRLILGSVTDYLVRSGVTPVLVWPSN